MKKLMTALLLAHLSVFAVHALGAETPAPTADYQHHGPKYPPVFFVTNVESAAFKEKLNGYGAFARLDSEAVGLPIGLRIVKGHRTKQDATTMSSVMLSASTLGLIPMVSSTEFKVYYDVYVQGKSIAEFEYQVDSTDVNHLWAANTGERKTKPAEELFMDYSLSLFLSDVQKSEKVQAAFAEYWQYFPPQ